MTGGHYVLSIPERDRLLDSMTNWNDDIHMLLNEKPGLFHSFSEILPVSFSRGWLWDSAALPSAESGVLQVQHGAHYRKSDARSEDNERSQGKETPSVSSSTSLPDRY